MFCFSCANHASTKLRKVLSWKTRQVYFIYPFPCRLKLEKSLETFCVYFFSLGLPLLSEKNLYFGKHLFCKTKTDYTCKLHVQDFATGKNFSFDQCSKQESFAFFLTVMQTLNFVSGLHNCLEFSQPLEFLYHWLCQHRKHFLLLNCKSTTEHR